MTAPLPAAGLGLLAGRSWMAQGTAIFTAAVQALPDEALSESTDLPGWSRRHVAAHVAANAEALTRLASWAKTGIEQRMYASAGQRADEIAAGAQLSASVLRDWLGTSATALEEALGSLTGPQWRREVVTAQGRSVPAGQLPWLRSREVMVHAVDLGAGRTFADLPADFIVALIEDVVAKRSASAGPAVTLAASDGSGFWGIDGSGAPAHIVGSLADLAAWLTGRSTLGEVVAADGSAPTLSAWL